ncbi:hypothetical protein [Nocardia terpenica]|uniref:Uncharacterized protein n=1 Tax=Nocardia terpenica TaxID=455432 RepID=A0A6G9Z591_9NOCA|nr:hypothetical protein [Nocardia terpenica]QIS20346.1 hypothetical protein F6W96_20660 [Nocardia terpenica]
MSQLESPVGLLAVADAPEAAQQAVAGQVARALLGMIEGFARREVDVAAACGLGRRPDPEQAWDAMDKAIALINAE